MIRYLKQDMPTKWDKVIILLMGLVPFFFLNHPDIIETTMHTRILLHDIFSGRFFDFYQDTMAAKEIFGYANAAHYHIIFYLLCAIWNLPLYLLSLLFSVSDFWFILHTKALGVVVWVLCGIVLQKIAQVLQYSQQEQKWICCFLWLCPVGFFTIFGMGQYDSLALFFILIALYYYFQDKMPLFVATMGVALVFKMFALFIFIPLLLLKEKRIWRILQYLLCSLWLYLPLSVLFLGNTGDMGFFNSLITERFFVHGLPVVGNASILLVILATVYFFCWIWTPKTIEIQNQFAIYLCLAVFSVLFLLVYWHPQWLVLLTPFLLLTIFKSKCINYWFVLHGIWLSGYFILLAFLFEGQLESNLFDFGILGEWFGIYTHQQELIRTNSIYFDLIPYLAKLTPVAFCATLLIGLIGKIPYKGKQLAEHLLPIETTQKVFYRGWAFGLFLVSFGAFWWIPSLFAWLKTMNLL